MLQKKKSVRGDMTWKNCHNFTIWVPLDMSFLIYDVNLNQRMEA